MVVTFEDVIACMHGIVQNLTRILIEMKRRILVICTCCTWLFGRELRDLMVWIICQRGHDANCQVLQR